MRINLYVKCNVYAMIYQWSYHQKGSFFLEASSATTAANESTNTARHPAVYFNHLPLLPLNLHVCILPHNHTRTSTNTAATFLLATISWLRELFMHCILLACCTSEPETAGDCSWSVSPSMILWLVIAVTRNVKNGTTTVDLIAPCKVTGTGQWILAFSGSKQA